MAFKPAIGKKYARLREEQNQLLGGRDETPPGVPDGVASSSQRLELLAAAATANAWQSTRPTFLDETRPELESQEWVQMESILVRAMELQQKHLVSLRERREGNEPEEEANSHASLEHIRKTLEATQIAMVHAGHREMLPAAAPQVLQYLNTRDSFAFRTVSQAVCRACQDGELLLMPCLDLVPEHRDDMPLFFTKLALGSTKVMWMNSVGTLQVLETRFALPALETLLLPAGLGILLEDLSVPNLPCLRRLYVKAGIDNESEFNWPKAVHSSRGALPDSLTLSGVQWIQDLISKTPQRLCLIDMEELDSRLTVTFMKVVAPRTRPKRLVLRRCVLPDAVIEGLCTSLEEGGSEHFAVHFDACELSVGSEQRLAQALEQFSFCAFSIDGGKVSEGPIEVSEWSQAMPRFVRERSTCSDAEKAMAKVLEVARGPVSPITESDSNEEEDEEDADDAPGPSVTAPPPRLNPPEFSTEEVLERLRRRSGSTNGGQVSSFDGISSFLASRVEEASSSSGYGRMCCAE